MSAKKISIVSLLILFLVSFLIRLTLFKTEFLREPDSVEYINVAQNIESGNGFTKSIKIDFFDQKPVIASGTLLRPMFTPFAYASLLRIYDDVYFLQFFNILLSSIIVILFYFLARSFLSCKFSFLASLLIALNPNLIIDSRFILNDQFFIFFIILFFIVFFKISDNFYKFVCLGFIAALAYLTRTEGILLLVILLVTKIRKTPLLSTALLSFVIFSSPSLILNYYVNGNPFYTDNAFHLSVLTYLQGLENFSINLPTPFNFVIKNYPEIIRIIISNILRSGLIGLRYLGLISIFLIFYFKKDNFLKAKKLFPIFLFSALLFLTVVSTWAVVFQAERHLQLVFMFLTIITFIPLSKVSKKVFYPIFLLTIFVYLAYNFHQITWLRQSIGELEKNKSSIVFSWIRENTKNNEIIATRYPLNMYLYTNRPSILIPTKLPNKLDNPKEFESYLKKFNVKYIYVEGNDLKDYLIKNDKLKIKNSSFDSLYCVKSC